jgi:tetratricopeptide (TPR) repeat protein
VAGEETPDDGFREKAMSPVRLVAVGLIAAVFATVSATTDAPGRTGKVESCAVGKALFEAGEKAEANKAYIEALEAQPGSECAAAGVEETSEPSLLDQVKTIGEDVLVALGALLLALAGLAGLYLLLIRVQSLIPWLKDRWPASAIRRPKVSIENLDDSAFELKLGIGTTALMKGWIEADSKRHFLKFVSGGSATEETWLSKVAEVGEQGKIAAALIGTFSALLPRRQVKVTGELQPATTSGGPGISVELHRKRTSTGTAALWADRFALPVDAGVAVDTLRKLVVPVAAWISHRVTSETGGKGLAAEDPMSWALFKAGVEWQRDGEVEKAAELYSSAAHMDGANYGARANLALIRARAGQYENAIDLLEEARAILEKPRMGNPLANPDWYRVNYSIAAEHTNWALEGERSQRAERLERASANARRMQEATARTLARRMWGAKAMRKERKELLAFLHHEVKPCLEVLAAGIQLAKEEMGSSKAAVEEALALVTHYAESADHGANVEYNLACLYAQAGERKAARAHLDAALEKTSPTEQLLLVWRVGHDSVLKSVRKGFLRSLPPEVKALRGEKGSPPRQRSWV